MFIYLFDTQRMKKVTKTTINFVQSKFLQCEKPTSLNMNEEF